MKAFAACIAVLPVLTATSAFASPVVSGNLYEDRSSCAGAHACDAFFSYFPSSVEGKLIRFETVNCAMDNTNLLTQIYIKVAPSGGSGRIQYLATPDRIGVHSTNQAINFTIGDSTTRRMSLSFLTTDTGSPTIHIDCIIDGTILN